MNKKLKVLIVGGCFPVQDNIQREYLYHQLLKAKLASKHNINLEITIIRYEIVSKCFFSITEAVALKKPDILLLHTRIEPLLASLKFYHEYNNTSGQKVRKLNAFSLKLENREKPLRKGSSHLFKTTRKLFFTENVMHKLFREMNFLLGKIAGNMKPALSSYSVLCDELKKFCKQNEIKLIITGPVSRPRSFFENYFSRKLHLLISPAESDENLYFINFLGEKDEQGESLFCEDQIRVNEKGHARIAELIYPSIRKLA